jgi:hypothetical protein
MIGEESNRLFADQDWPSSGVVTANAGLAKRIPRVEEGDKLAVP